MHWNNSVTQSTGELHCGQQTVGYCTETLTEATSVQVISPH